jgi:hypothetical protein
MEEFTSAYISYKMHAFFIILCYSMLCFKIIKMAEVLLPACEPAVQICKLSVINHTSQCNACKVYKDQIKLLTQELLSSKKIIQ